MIEKLNMQTADLAQRKLQLLKELFPNVITETIVDGKVVQAIDKDALMQEVNTAVVEGKEERYQITWPGKRNAIVEANAPTTKTLRPMRADSTNFDTTENIYIEGDNLEVLKLLQENYLGQVKMIYIDPPYNTGKDFVYKDKSAMSTEEYLQLSGQYSEDDQVMVPLLETDGQFHTKWLNSLYPRLKVARNLLTDDGVIFISIDSHEVVNLKKICDEIFGEKNFIEIFNWAKTETPENLSKKSKQIIEYVLCYQKKKDAAKFKGIKKTSVSSNGLLNQPNAVHELVFPAEKVLTSIPNQVIPAGKYGTDAYDIQLLEDTEVKDGLFIKPVRLVAKFKWSQDNLNREIAQGTIIRIPTLKLSPSYEKQEYDAEVPANLINSKVGVDTNEVAGNYQIELFDKKVFSYPKPISLIKYLLGFNDDENEDIIVLDFFSGSATTADAVMHLNAERGQNHFKYIMVQLPEDLESALAEAKSPNEKEIIENAIALCDELGKPRNLCEVAKERIRRAAKKVATEHPDADIDYGFRVLKLDSSNMQNVFYTPGEYSQNANLFTLTEDNIKPDRSEEDLLFQAMLELNCPMSAPVETMEIEHKKVFNVGENHILACFDKDVDEGVITAIAKMKPNYFVMRDSSQANDSVAVNFEQIFNTYCPDDTKVKVF